VIIEGAETSTTDPVLDEPPPDEPLPDELPDAGEEATPLDAGTVGGVGSAAVSTGAGGLEVNTRAMIGAVGRYPGPMIGAAVSPEACTLSPMNGAFQAIIGASFRPAGAPE
jgi:hypothetical protein